MRTQIGRFLRAVASTLESRTPERRRREQRCRLEALEDRRVPAAVMTPTLPLTDADGAAVPNDPTAYYVYTLYQNVLDRKPETAGLTALNNEIHNGVGAQHVALQVINSPEHYGQQVDQLYKSLLNRNETAAERTGWVNELSSGKTLTQVEQQFLTSPEYQGLHTTDKAYIDSLYQNVLNRADSAEEQAGWLTAIQAGATRAQVAHLFLTSHEANTDAVENDYLTALGRPLDAYGTQVWVGMLDAGTSTPQQVQAAILGSPEGQDHSVTEVTNPAPIA